MLLVIKLLLNDLFWFYVNHIKFILVFYNSFVYFFFLLEIFLRKWMSFKNERFWIDCFTDRLDCIDNFSGKHLWVMIHVLFFLFRFYVNKSGQVFLFLGRK